jgi:uncharacterized membrane protein
LKTLDRVFAWLLLALGLPHIGVSMVLMSRNLNPSSIWFFAGGLAVIFGAFLNLIRTHHRDKIIALVTSIANLLLVVLAILLCWIVRHDLKANPQVAAFVLLAVVELLFSIRQ